MAGNVASSLLPSLASGVCHQPGSLSLVGRSGMDSTHHGRLAGVVEYFQVREHPVSSTAAESRYVLNDDESGPQLGDEASVFGPKTGPSPINTGAFAGNTDVLAGKAATDDVGHNSICRQPFGRERAHIFIAGSVRPVLGQHTPAKWIDLAKGDGLEAARAFQSQAETANAGEQVEGPQHGTPNAFATASTQRWRSSKRSRSSCSRSSWSFRIAASAWSCWG